MSNRINRVNTSTLLDNKLKVLLRDYEDLTKLNNVNEQEELVNLFNGVLSRFISTLESPLFSDDYKVKAGEIVDYLKLNEMLLNLSRDIEILYLEIGSMHNSIVRNYNNVVSFGDRVKSRLKSVRSKIATYKQYSNSDDLLFFQDSFDNQELIESAQKLYNAERCNLNINEGMITLPIDTSSVKTLRVSGLSIGPSSNGTLGNNQEIGQLQRASLNGAVDGNSDTWFEYELVTRDAIKTPLILELLFILEEEAIINNLEIQANSFAVRNFPRITELQTSLDGNFYVDLIEDIPISKETLDSESDLLVLSPSAGKFSGINSFSFKPRRAKYVKLKIQQDDSYLIKTPSGLKHRKAIGIREVAIKSIPYKPKGELVSTTHLASDEIKKLSLSLTKNEFNGLTKIESQVTYDDNTWLNITPIGDTGPNEVISFNTIDTNSINTNSPINTIRYKSILTRNTPKFSEQDQVVKSQIPVSEFLSLDPSTVSLELSNQPIASSMDIFGVAYGKVGGEPLLILSGDISVFDDYTLIELPKAFVGKTIDPDSIHLFVNKQPWTRVNSLSASASVDKHFIFDAVNNQLRAGNDTNGKKPEGTIEITFDREQLLFSYDIPRTATLNFDSDSVEESFKFYKLGDQATFTNIVLQKSARILRLGATDIDSIIVVQDDQDILLDEKDYVNGSVELDGAGDYSVDYINGVIYTFSETPETEEVIINFSYKPRTYVKNFEVDGDQVSVSTEEYSSKEISEDLVLSSRFVINLSNSFIEPKSIQFLTLASNFVREVPYKGDGSEFDLDLPPSELNGLYTVDYKRGKIYMKNAITGTLSLTYRFTNFFVEYNIARKIPSNYYTIDGTSIVFGDNFVIEEFGDSLSAGTRRNLYRVNYSFIEETHDNLKELEPYYTPFLRDYRLQALPRSKF